MKNIKIYCKKDKCVWRVDCGKIGVCSIYSCPHRVYYRNPVKKKHTNDLKKAIQEVEK